jgi:hypothetical protein
VDTQTRVDIFRFDRSGASDATKDKISVYRWSGINRYIQLCDNTKRGAGTIWRRKFIYNIITICHIELLYFIVILLNIINIKLYHHIPSHPPPPHNLYSFSHRSIVIVVAIVIETVFVSPSSSLPVSAVSNNRSKTSVHMPCHLRM